MGFCLLVASSSIQRLRSKLDMSGFVPQRRTFKSNGGLAPNVLEEKSTFVKNVKNVKNVY